MLLYMQVFIRLFHDIFTIIFVCTIIHYLYISYIVLIFASKCILMLRIKELCEIKGMTLQELAKSLNITYQSLWAQMTGNPSLSKLQAIAAALGVSVPELFAPKPTNTITCPKCGTVLEVKERKESWSKS